MLFVEFKGRMKNRKKYEQFACEVVDHLLPRSFKRDIVIGIEFVKTLDACGYCTLEGEDEILIQVNTENDEKTIAQTIAHELVHAKQYIRGELNSTMTRWMRQEVAKGLKYDDQPWEIEAFEKEVELTEMYWND